MNEFSGGQLEKLFLLFLLESAKLLYFEDFLQKRGQLFKVREQEIRGLLVEKQAGESKKDSKKCVFFETSFIFIPNKMVGKTLPFSKRGRTCFYVTNCCKF